MKDGKKILKTAIIMIFIGIIIFLLDGIIPKIIGAFFICSAIYSFLHPEEVKNPEEKKKTAPAPVVYRKTYEVISEDKKFGVIESRFEKKEFWQNGLYLSSMRELNDAGYDVGDIVYKWNIQTLTCRADLKEDSADIYASADGSEYEYIGTVPDLNEGNKALFVDSKITLKAEGSTGYEILYNSSAQRRKKGPEKYYPWRFTVSVEKTVAPDE